MQFDRIAIFGAGGIGSFFGGMLARAGHEVALVCRGRHLEAVRAQGLTVKHARGPFTVHPLATDDTVQVGPVDVVFNCVKLYDLRASAAQMLPLLGPKTIVVTTQNGVCARDEIASVVPAAQILSGAAFSSAHLVEPGVVGMRGNMDQLILGEHEGGASERAIALAHVGTAAGLRVEASADIRQALWRKYVLLGSLCLVCCLSRQPVAAIPSSPGLRELMVALMREIMAVAAASGVPLEEGVVDYSLQYAQDAPPGVKVSMHEDLDAGRRLELEWLAGHLSREGARLKVPTPVTDIALACLRPFADGSPAAARPA